MYTLGCRTTDDDTRTRTQKRVRHDRDDTRRVHFPRFPATRRETRDAKLKPRNGAPDVLTEESKALGFISSRSSNPMYRQYPPSYAPSVPTYLLLALSFVGLRYLSAENEKALTSASINSAHTRRVAAAILIAAARAAGYGHLSSFPSSLFFYALVNGLVPRVVPTRDRAG